MGGRGWHCALEPCHTTQAILTGETQDADERIERAHRKFG